MASCIKAFLLSLLISFSNSENCQIPSLWNSFSTSVTEDIKVNELFLSVEDENAKNITSRVKLTVKSWKFADLNFPAKIVGVRWTDLSDASAKYFEFTQDLDQDGSTNGWAIKVVQEITDAVDCVSVKVIPNDVVPEYW